MLTGDVHLNLAPLLELKGKGVRTAIRIGVNRAAKPVKAAYVAEAQAIARYGFLGKSVGTKQQTYRDGLVTVAVIGPKRSYVRTKGSYTRGKKAGEKRRIRPANYARIVDQGTGRSRARKFASNAMARAGAQYPDAAAREIKAEIEKILPTGG